MMNRWNRLVFVALALFLALGLCACAGTPVEKAASSDDAQTAPAKTEAPVSTGTAGTEARTEAESQTPPESTAVTPAPAGKDTLVVYFSATGTTKAVAEQIAAITDADLYEIKAAQEYTEADLNWHDSNSRTTLEQNDNSVRPEISSEDISLEGYTTIYIGYPIWWGEEPRIMDTFVERYDFDGMTLIPFCTSSSSGIGRSGQNLADNAGSGNWLDGKRFGAGPSEDALREWIEGLN